MMGFHKSLPYLGDMIQFDEHMVQNCVGEIVRFGSSNDYQSFHNSMPLAFEKEKMT